MKTLRVVLAMVLITFGVASCQAGTLYSTGFENPPFVLGPINGQAGWFVYSASGQFNDPLIESTLVKTGLQAVSVDGSVTAQTGPVYAPNYVFPSLDMSADIYLSSSTSESSWQFASTGSGGIGFAGGIDVNGTDIVAITGNHTDIIGTLTRDSWHHVDVIFNYSSQTYSVKLDGATLAAGLAFCGNNHGNCNGAPVTTMGWDLFDSFGGGNDLGAMDNFSISTTTPEPGTLGLLGSGLLVGIGIVRRKFMR